jgi:hypothetical protein
MTKQILIELILKAIQANISESKSFEFLNLEEELYSLKDLKEVYNNGKG